MKDDKKPIEGEFIESRPVGRPSKFKDEYISEVEDLMGQGYTDARICANWNIGRTTFYEWLKNNKEFKRAHNRGLEKAEAWWEEFGLAGMTGKIPKFNSTMWIAFMNNKFKWSRNHKGDDGGTQINIGNMQVLQNLQELSNSELDTKIQGLLSNLGIEDGSKRDQEGTSSPTGGEESETEV